jgi:hypothetical protein
MNPRPVRLQLSRRRGFNLQALSRSINGRPAVWVARAGKAVGKWGNPFRIGDPNVPDAPTAVRLHREWLESMLDIASPAHAAVTAALADMARRNLACWCHLCARHRPTGKPVGEICHDCAPCHADTLLELANR